MTRPLTEFLWVFKRIPIISANPIYSSFSVLFSSFKTMISSSSSLSSSAPSIFSYSYLVFSTILFSDCLINSNILFENWSTLSCYKRLSPASSIISLIAWAWAIKQSVSVSVSMASIRLLQYSLAYAWIDAIFSGFDSLRHFIRLGRAPALEIRILSLA